MEPVKITDTKEWSSIDIFLFSNGQQYSPPRKYHLRSEELQWWGTTMSYLGRTHYGSGHSSIELYAIDGKKINGPLELVNGAAYVAVEPPDSFINTGYEDYLLRATRSWEKRLAQKSYNTQQSNLDLECEKTATQEDKDNLNTPDNIINTTSLKVASNTSPQKARPNKPYPRLQRKSITSPGQIQKKKSCDTHSAVLKRICAETDKIIPCPKKAPLKKNGFMNQRPSINVPRKRNETTNQDLSSCCKKRDSTKPESNPITETSNNINACETVSREPQIVDLFKNDGPDSVSVKNENDSYAITDNAMHHNGQINLTQDSVIVLKDFTSKKESGITKDLEKDLLNNLKEINEYKESDIPKNNYLSNEIEKDHRNSIPINTNKNKDNKSYDTLLNKCEKEVIDEYVAQMNKGGFLLLKLKVKLKDCKTIFNRGKAKNVSAAISLSNLPKTEKTSQVDINISFSGELLKSNDQQNNQDRSLQSLLNKLCLDETYKQMDNTKPRIIIVQCACRNYSDNHKCCMCDTVQGSEVEDGKFNVPMNLTPNETVTGCECQDQYLRLSKAENVMKNEIITQTSKDTNKNRPSMCYSNGTRVKDLAQKFEKCDKAMSNDKNTNSNIKANDNNTSKNENQRQSVVLTKLIGLPVLDKGTDHIEEENNNSKSFCNKSTQTDWCNLLIQHILYVNNPTGTFFQLEARLQEDSLFTFHLPSLYMLKQYNL